MPIWVALLVGAFAPAAWAGSISGNVRDESTGLPVSGVQVSAWREASPIESVASVDFTDAGGRYEISGLPEADYIVQFSPSGQNYVPEYYENKDSNLDADPVHLGQSESRTIDASLTVGGRITGQVVSAVGGIPLEGVSVCAGPPDDEQGGCSDSGADGTYAIQGLPTNSYVVDFSPYWALNYFDRWYGGTTERNHATAVPVTAGMTVSGINEGLLESAGVSGTLTDSATGEPVGRVEVCTIEVGGEEFPRCSETKADGHYLVGGMETGSYRLVFSPETRRDKPERQEEEDGYFAQYYKEATSQQDAVPIFLTAPGLRTGVDAVLVPKHPRPPAPAIGPPNPYVSPLTTPAVRSTTFLGRGRSRVRKRMATFWFHASRAGVGFRCRLDGHRAVPCSSPVKFSGLSYGWHHLEVRADAAAGPVAPSQGLRWAFHVERYRRSD